MNNMKKVVLLLPFLTILSLSNNAKAGQSEVYKYVENGITIYTEKVPEGKSYEILNMKEDDFSLSSSVTPKKDIKNKKDKLNKKVQASIESTPLIEERLAKKSNQLEDKNLLNLKKDDNLLITKKEIVKEVPKSSIPVETKDAIHSVKEEQKVFIDLRENKVMEVSKSPFWSEEEELRLRNKALEQRERLVAEREKNVEIKEVKKVETPKAEVKKVETPKAEVKKVEVPKNIVEDNKNIEAKTEFKNFVNEEYKILLQKEQELKEKEEYLNKLSKQLLEKEQKLKQQEEKIVNLRKQYFSYITNAKAKALSVLNSEPSSKVVPIEKKPKPVKLESSDTEVKKEVKKEVKEVKEVKVDLDKSFASEVFKGETKNTKKQKDDSFVSEVSSSVKPLPIPKLQEKNKGKEIKSQDGQKVNIDQLLNNL